MNKIKLTLTLSFDITKDQWKEGKDKWVEDIKEKLSYDHWDMLHHLRDFSYPNLDLVVISEGKTENAVQNSVSKSI